METARAHERTFTHCLRNGSCLFIRDHCTLDLVFLDVFTQSFLQNHCAVCRRTAKQSESRRNCIDILLQLDIWISLCNMFSLKCPLKSAFEFTMVQHNMPKEFYVSCNNNGAIESTHLKRPNLPQRDRNDGDFSFLTMIFCYLAYGL